MKYKLLTEPLTAKDRDAEGWVKGVVAVELNEIVDYDSEDFMDLLSERLVGDQSLMDFGYKVVGHDGDEIHIEVEGDASLSFDS